MAPAEHYGHMKCKIQLELLQCILEGNLSQFLSTEYKCKSQPETLPLTARDSTPRIQNIPIHLTLHLFACLKPGRVILFVC